MEKFNVGDLVKVRYEAEDLSSLYFGWSATRDDMLGNEFKVQKVHPDFILINGCPFTFESVELVEKFEKWEPKFPEPYYFITSKVEISARYYDNHESSLKKHDLLGIFKTKEEAEKRRDDIKQFISTL